jgi:hypothetical protein
MSGGKIIPVIAAGDRDAVVRLEEASDRLHAEYVRGFCELRDRIDELRAEIRQTIGELTTHSAELERRIEVLERRGEAPKING